MKLFKQILSFLILSMFLAFASSVSAQSQDPCAGERANLKRLYAQQAEQNKNPNNYTLADANRLTGDITTALKTLADCENAHGNAKPGTPAKPATQNPSATVPPNEDDKVRQAMLDALKAKQDTAAANSDDANQIVGLWQGMAPDNAGAHHIAMSFEFHPDGSGIRIYSCQFNGGGEWTYKRDFQYQPTGKNQWTAKFGEPVTISGNGHVGWLASRAFKKPCLITVSEGVLTANLSSDTKSARFTKLQDTPNSGDQKMSESRQNIRDKILNDPLLQDPPKDAPVGDGSGKPSGFTDGVDFSTDRSLTKPATPPPDQK